MFFLLEQKEPKIQDKPDPSGRFVGPFRAWATTCRFGMSALLSCHPDPKGGIFFEAIRNLLLKEDFSLRCEMTKLLSGFFNFRTFLNSSCFFYRYNLSGLKIKVPVFVELAEPLAR